MVIRKDTAMLLFRFSNYKRYSFIEEHMECIKRNGYVWMMKIGKRTNQNKIAEIKEHGGYMVLKSPVNDGDNYFIAIFEEFIDGEPPKGGSVPGYYSELLENDEFVDLSVQSFKINKIVQIESADNLKLQLNGNSISDTIKRTRTAVMFVYNDSDIRL